MGNGGRVARMAGDLFGFDLPLKTAAWRIFHQQQRIKVCNLMRFLGVPGCNRKIFIYLYIDFRISCHY